MDQENKLIIPIEYYKHASQSSGPGNRINHVVAFHNKQLFVVGGIPTLSVANPEEDHRVVHYYSFDTKNWGKKDVAGCVPSPHSDVNNEGDVSQAQKFGLSYQAYCTVNGIMYVFGGSNYKNESCNDFMALDLATIEWTIIKNDSSPQARESASMAALTNNVLVLYGGINLQQINIYQFVDLYFIEENIWKRAQGDYHFILRPRYLTSMCCAKDKIYLYGGQFDNHLGEHFTLNDFYCLTPSQLNPNEDVWLTCSQVRTSDKSRPESKSGHRLESYGEYLVLIGGDNKEMDLIGSAWVFSICSNVWKKITLDSGIQKLNGFACCRSEERIYLFGGVNSHDSVKCDIFAINMKNILPDLAKEFKKEPVKMCSMCPLISKRKPIRLEVSKQTMESFVNLMDFPFLAFGLLLDNSQINASPEFGVEYACENNYVNSDPMLVITDFSTLPYSHEELVNTIANFECSLQYHSVSVMDRKVKAQLQREHNLREYGIFLKLGALRLGQQFSFVVFKGVMMSVYALMLNAENNYEFLSYEWDWSTKQVVEGEEAWKKIWEKFGSRMNPYLSKSDVLKYNRCFIFIFKLRNTIDNVLELQGTTELMDIQYTPYRRILGAHSPLLRDSIDVSLKAYLSAFYIKNQYPRLKLKVGGKEIVITTQKYLESYDKMTSNRTTFQIDNSSVNIELKVMELYFNPNLTLPTDSFHNGVLIYHRGRLINRFGCRLGEMYSKEDTRLFNFFHLFGLLEVPDQVQTNLFRSDFIYHVMMEKLKSKLKSLEEELIVTFPHDRQMSKKNKTVMKQKKKEQYQERQKEKARDKMRQEQRDKEKQKRKARLDERFYQRDGPWREEKHYKNKRQAEPKNQNQKSQSNEEKQKNYQQEGIVIVGENREGNESAGDNQNNNSPHSNKQQSEKMQNEEEEGSRKMERKEQMEGEGEEIHQISEDLDREDQLSQKSKSRMESQNKNQQEQNSCSMNEDSGQAQRQEERSEFQQNDEKMGQEFVDVENIEVSQEQEKEVEVINISEKQRALKGQEKAENRVEELEVIRDEPEEENDNNEREIVNQDEGSRSDKNDN